MNFYDIFITLITFVKPKMIKTSEKLAEDQTKLLLTATELENEDDSPPSEGEDKQKYDEAMQASAELSAKLTYND